MPCQNASDASPVQSAGTKDAFEASDDGATGDGIEAAGKDGFTGADEDAHAASIAPKPTVEGLHARPTRPPLFARREPNAANRRACLLAPSSDGARRIQIVCFTRCTETLFS